MTRNGALPLIAPILSGVLLIAGCADDRALVVATPWDRPACLGLEAAIRGEDPAISAPIRWIRIAPWDDPSLLFDRDQTIDVLLGWSEPTIDHLRRRGLLATATDAPESAIRWVRAPDHRDGPGPEEGRPSIGVGRIRPMTSNDPRIDPRARFEVSNAFARGDWAVGYAGLLGREASPGDSPRPAPTRQAVAMPRESDHPDASRFLALVADLLGEQEAPGPSGPTRAPEAGLVEAELIGATAIDAGKELRSAWAALERSTDAERLGRRLAEPPPWPPASIQELKADPARASLVNTLAEALVEAPGARARLLASWDRPPGTLDRATLVELASIDGGRLLVEPQFLPWLRAEWTAWARQRYRQVAAEAGGAR